MAKLKEHYERLLNYPPFVVKEQFHRDAMNLMKAVGRELKRDGIMVKSHSNKAGIAVSGEVYSDIRLPGTVAYLLVEVGTCHVNIGYDLRDDFVFICISGRAPNFTVTGIPGQYIEQGNFRSFEQIKKVHVYTSTKFDHVKLADVIRRAIYTSRAYDERVWERQAVTSSERA